MEVKNKNVKKTKQKKKTHWLILMFSYGYILTEYQIWSVLSLDKAICNLDQLLSGLVLLFGMCFSTQWSALLPQERIEKHDEKCH